MSLYGMDFLRNLRNELKVPGQLDVVCKTNFISTRYLKGNNYLSKVINDYTFSISISVFHVIYSTTLVRQLYIQTL